MRAQGAWAETAAAAVEEGPEEQAKEAGMVVADEAAARETAAGVAVAALPDEAEAEAPGATST